MSFGARFWEKPSEIIWIFGFTWPHCTLHLKSIFNKIAPEMSRNTKIVTVQSFSPADQTQRNDCFSRDWLTYGLKSLLEHVIPAQNSMGKWVFTPYTCTLLLSPLWRLQFFFPNHLVFLLSLWISSSFASDGATICLEGQSLKVPWLMQGSDAVSCWWSVVYFAGCHGAELSRVQ